MMTRKNETGLLGVLLIFTILTWSTGIFTLFLCTVLSFTSEYCISVKKSFSSAVKNQDLSILETLLYYYMLNDRPSFHGIENRHRPVTPGAYEKNQ